MRFKNFNNNNFSNKFKCSFFSKSLTLNFSVNFILKKSIKTLDVFNKSNVSSKKLTLESSSPSQCREYWLNKFSYSPKTSGLDKHKEVSSSIFF